jgi:nucleoside-diphosphate-sugar epimerase
MRVLVTGATGVVGRRAVPLLVAAGHAVTAVGRSQPKRDALRAAGATPVDLDLFDAAAVRRAVAGHDAVVNVATHMPSSSTAMLLPWAWRENDRVRREGSAALAEAARAEGVSRFVQESFAPIYADGGDAWIDETWPVRPTRYNRSVLDAERSAERFAAAGGAGVVLRFGGFYGPDAFHMREMLDVARRGWLALPGPPEAFASCVSHDDAATAVVAALALPSGTYNVVDDEPLRRRDWAAALAHAFGIPTPRPLPRWLTRLGGSITELLSRSQRMSNAKLRAAAGWAPRWPSVREGFVAMAETMRGG